MSPIDPQRVARELAEELLFPAAAATDTSDHVPRGHLDRIAEAGMYGLVAPVDSGGLGADQSMARACIEVMAGGCLTTTFVWMHHHGALRAVGASATPGMRERWFGPMCRGERRAGFALGGILPGSPGVTAHAVDGGWLLRGVAPWVTGWRLVDVIHTAAHGPDGDILWTLIDTVDSPTMTSRRLHLVAVHASDTVSVRFDDHFVPADRVTRTEPLAAWVGGGPPEQQTDFAELGRPAPGRHYMATLTAAMALGVADRCCRLLGPGPLDDEVAAVRAALDDAAAGEPAALPQARARASELAVRAAAASVVATGSRSVLLEAHPQRLLREATFLLVFGTRAPIPTELLKLFGAAA